MRNIMIAAMGSGSGKTIVTAGLLMAIKKRNIRVRSFKCGPDYIDPMFHTRILGIPCRNLDLFLLGERGVLRENAGQELTVIEGAMGFYDGVGGTTTASAYEIARLIGAPVILVVKPFGQSATLAAQILGLMRFREGSNIAGVILNECRAGLYHHLRSIIERECGIPVFGYMPKMEEADIESRHLGLLSAFEVPSFRERFESIGAKMEETVDIDRIIACADLAAGSAGCENERDSMPDAAENAACKSAADAIPGRTAEDGPGKSPENICRIAYALDEAFSFYYETSLDALRRAGAYLVPFSPVRDSHLPTDISGLYLGGGYPENFAAELSANETMRKDIRVAVRNGLPTVAECGGFMYLQDTLEGLDGKVYPMAGALPGNAARTPGLVRFGYVSLEAREDSMLFRAGETVHAHEFHHWDSSVCGDGLLARKHDGRQWACGMVSDRMYAGYPHLELGGDVPLAERLVRACREYAISSRTSCAGKCTEDM